MKNSIITTVFVLLTIVAFAQKNTYKGFPSLIWPKLYEIQFVKATDKLGDYEKPIFSAAAKSIDGKLVTIPGYIVPFETGMKSNHLMLSSLPLNACFFCGVGGPETVIEVYLKKEITYTEKPIEVQGVLKLNDKNPDKMIYILENAEMTGEIEF
jgi:hypothetical protein